jgi:hypothetical protein
VTISDKTRKILWARSGNLCAMCRRVLVEGATTLDVESVIGEECHIVAQSEFGPRHGAALLDDYDAPANLILLCRNHHKLVDDQRDTYAADVLRSLKVNHERWVTEKLGETAGRADPARVVRVPENVPSHLARIASGRDLVGVLDGAMGYQFSNDELRDEAELDAISGFLQEAQEVGDLFSELEAGQRVEIEFRLGRSIRDLEELGFWVFGGREVRVLQGGGIPPSSFPIAILDVVRHDNLAIRHAELDRDYEDRTVEFDKRK